MSGIRLNLFIIVLITILLFFQWRLWFESGGVTDLWRLKKNLTLQSIENQKLKKRNEQLLFQVHRLQNSQDAIESRARNELGMIKKGETFYQVIDGRMAKKN